MHRTSIAVILAMAGLILAACSDGSDDDGGGGPYAGGDLTTTTAGGATETQQCESVPFTPNSEDMASDVTATGLSCEEAEAFVRIAGERTSSGGPDEVDVEGYHCVVTRSEQDPLPRAFYECTKAEKKVTFVRS